MMYVTQRLARGGIGHHAACIALVLLATACKGEDFPSRAVMRTAANTPGLATRDMAPVTLHLQEEREKSTRLIPFYGETTLTVPKAYLHGEEHWNGHISLNHQVTLEAALPDMRPWTVYGEDLFARMKETHSKMLTDNVDAFSLAYTLKDMQDTVQIRVGYGNCFAGVKSMPALLAEQATKDNGYTDPMFEKFDWSYQKSRHYYVPREPAKWQTYIDCPDYGGEVRRCKGMTDYDALVSFEYWFHFSRLREYKEVEDKARALIGSFITKNQATAAMPASCLTDVIRK